MDGSPFVKHVRPDWEELLRCIRRQGQPKRVHCIELLLDDEIQEAICERFDVRAGFNHDDPYFDLKTQIALQRFLGYDYVTSSLEGVELAFNGVLTDDTAGLQRPGGRSFIDEHSGPITSWAELEGYPWPDAASASTRSLEWYEANLPDDMCVIGFRGFGHLLEYITWLLGYETLCYALHDRRDLVTAVSEKVTGLSTAVAERVLQFSRVKALWGSDDMGFRTGTLISPKDLREFVLPGHKRLAQLAHDAGRPYLLHSCGQLRSIMPDLIEDVKIDAKHSFEDVIEPVTSCKRTYGDRIALLGGIDMDFLCRAEPDAVRGRVRETLDQCMPGGGYCLGTGNSVANYVPLGNYLAMLDEGRAYGW